MYKSINESTKKYAFLKINNLINYDKRPISYKQNPSLNIYILIIG